MDSKWCSVSRKDKNIFFGPIHVSEMLQDDLVSLDWGNWILCERTLINSSCAPENACSSVFEGSVEPLNFDNFLTISNSIGTSVLQNEVSLDQSPSQGRYMHPMSPTASSMLADGQVALRQQLKYLEVVHFTSFKVDYSFVFSSNFRTTVI
ncbi:hypothetical protein HHK36_030414 [Tetracentron sinense]|uniref:Uncharacterized protein n=1 Tax=Tetracentron sinense TaxID=13715 RepID=A0A834YBN2_TETSI|nr:hypothetical protein HHK36_030414 [Tetracentron sinense]